MIKSEPKRVKVLFLCLGNSCRRPMAEGIARHAAGDVIEASSAGLIALGFVAGSTVRVLEEFGYSAEGLRSKMLTREAVDSADLVINMSGRPVVAQLVKGKTQVEDWEVDDPYGEDPDAYSGTIQDIERRVEYLAELLRSAKGMKQ